MYENLSVPFFLSLYLSSSALPSDWLMAAVGDSCGYLRFAIGFSIAGIVCGVFDAVYPSNDGSVTTSSDSEGNHSNSSIPGKSQPKYQSSGAKAIDDAIQKAGIPLLKYYAEKLGITARVLHWFNENIRDPLLSLWKSFSTITQIAIIGIVAVAYYLSGINKKVPVLNGTIFGLDVELDLNIASKSPTDLTPAKAGFELNVKGHYPDKGHVPPDFYRIPPTF